VTSLSNGGQVLANTYAYDSFGKLTASTGTLTNPFQYTGREFDQETGAYYYRARYYDQNVGRFVGEDPIGLEVASIFMRMRVIRPSTTSTRWGWCETISCTFLVMKRNISTATTDVVLEGLRYVRSHGSGNFVAGNLEINPEEYLRTTGLEGK